MSDVAPAAEVAANVPAQRSESSENGNGVIAGASDKIGDAVERATAVSGRVASAVVDRLRNEGSLVAERGATTIADEVVEKIAGIAARSVPGVHDLGGDAARIFAAVRERVGLGDADDDADRGVKVRLEGAKAIVDITLVIEYGQIVRTVTDAVRAEVIAAVERMLNLEVTEVNIRVDDVHVADGAAGAQIPAPVAEPAPAAEVAPAAADTSAE